MRCEGYGSKGGVYAQSAIACPPVTGCLSCICLASFVADSEPGERATGTPNHPALALGARNGRTRRLSRDRAPDRNRQVASPDNDVSLLPITTTRFLPARLAVKSASSARVIRSSRVVASQG